MTNLIVGDRGKIEQRVEEKRRRLVGWLRDEGCVDYKLAAAILGVTPNASYKTLQKMEKDGLLEKYAVGDVSVWGLTPTGSLLYLEEKDDPTALFDGRIKPITLAHTFDCQRARLIAEAAGWGEWQGEKVLKRQAGKYRTEWRKVPDALAVDSMGNRVAVEVERTAKTTKRYREIIAEYLQMRKAGQIHEVHYLCPLPAMANGLARLFSEIRTISIDGKDVQLREEHHAAFKFFALDNWLQ